MNRDVLLVDDDAKLLRLVEATLRLKGLGVRKAETAAEALSMVKVHAPDLVISDTALPDLAGFELLERVRSLAGLDELPFIFLSSDGSPSDVLQGLRIGASEYLRKPFSIDELLARVLRVLDVGLDRPDTPKGVFYGSLSEQSLPDVLRMLVVQNQTGELDVLPRRCNAEGKLLIEGGRVVDAWFGLLSGVDALFALLLHKEGTYAFAVGAPGAPGEIEEITLPLLMEGFRLIDEGVLRKVDPSVAETARMVQRLVEAHRRPTPTVGEERQLHPDFADTMQVELDGFPDDLSDPQLSTADFAPAFLTAELEALERSDPATTGTILIESEADLELPAVGEEELPSAVALVIDEAPLGDVMDVYKTLKVAATRELSAHGVQLGTRAGDVIASNLPDVVRRETVAGFAAEALHFASRGPTGRRFASLDAGDLHVVVLDVDGARNLALLFEDKPEALAVIAVLEDLLPEPRE